MPPPNSPELEAFYSERARPASVPAAPPDQLYEAARQYGYTDEQIADYRRSQAEAKLAKQRGLSEDPAIQQAFESAGSRNLVPESQIDRTQGAPAGVRAEASFISHPAARFDFFRKHFGTEKTTLTPSGEILFKGENNKWHPIDEAKFTLADFADMAGDAPELLGQIAPFIGKAATYGSKIMRALMAAGGATAGRTVKGAVGGDLEPRDLAASATLAAATQGMVDIGAISPAPTAMGAKNYLRKKALEGMDKANTGGYAKESLSLAEQANQPILAFQVSQDPWLTMLAGYSARSSLANPLYTAGEQSMERAAKTQFTKVMLDLPVKSKTDPAFGTIVSDTIGTELSDLLTKRKAVSKEMFGFLDEALGREHSIPVINYVETLKAEAAKIAERGIPGEETAVTALLKAASLGKGTGLTSADAIQSLLADYGDKSFGGLTGKVFEGLSDAANTRVSRDLHAALLEDLKAAEPQISALRGPEAAKRVRAAREAYSMASAPIDQLEKLPIMGIMENKYTAAPEELARWVLTNPNPTHLKNMVQVLQKTNPALADEMAVHIMSNAFREGTKAASVAGFDRKAFFNALPDMDVLRAIYSGVGSEAQKGKGMAFAADMEALGKAIERNLWKGGQRPVFQEAPAPLIVNAWRGIKEGSPMALISSILIPRTIANIMHMSAADRAAILAAIQKAETAQPLPHPLRTAVLKTFPALFATGISEMNPASAPGQGPIGAEQNQYFSSTLARQAR